MERCRKKGNMGHNRVIFDKATSIQLVYTARTPYFSTSSANLGLENMVWR